VRCPHSSRHGSVPSEWRQPVAIAIKDPLLKTLFQFKGRPEQKKMVPVHKHFVFRPSFDVTDRAPLPRRSSWHVSQTCGVTCPSGEAFTEQKLKLLRANMSMMLLRSRRRMDCRLSQTEISFSAIGLHRGTRRHRNALESSPDEFDAPVQVVFWRR
jgi:hypothetical protein